MYQQQACEQPTALTAVAGVYNATLKLCLCPEGYSQEDLLHQSLECDVVLEFQRSLTYAVLGVETVVFKVKTKRLISICS